MAWGTQTNTSSGGNVNLGIQAGYSNVSRSGNTVYATLHGRMGMGKDINNSTTWSSNEFGIWLPSGGTKYTAKAAKTQSTANKWYEKTRDCSWTVAASATSLTAKVGFGWEDWDASEKVTASVSIPFNANTGSFNLNILNPDGSEPYSTGEAGSVEQSVGGGSYSRVYNESASSYVQGTTFNYRNFWGGTGRHLSSVSGISPSNTSGPWSTTQGSSTTVTFQTAWNTYTITIRRGTGISDITSPAWGWTGNYKTGSATYGNSFNINASVSAGYHWSGWTGTYTTSTQSYTFTVNQNVDVTANAVANTYTIRYNANGGSGSMSDTGATYGSNVTLRANSFSRSGYSFAGWATSSGGGKVYNNQQTVSNLTTTNGGVVTLYAVWTLNAPSAASHTIQYATRSKIGISVSGSGAAISNYTVYYRANSTGSYSSLNLGTGTSGVITGLSPNTTYQIFVRVTNAAGSKDSTASTRKTIAYIPSGLSVSVSNTLPFTTDLSVTGNGDTNAGITNRTVYCCTKPNKPIYDMAIKTLSDGSLWARIFYHNIKDSTVLFSSVSEARNTQTADKYSRLYLLDDDTYKGSDGKFEFMLCYPNDTTQYNRWKQTNNPCSIYTGGGTGTFVPGYEAIHIDWAGNSWGGLERNSSDASSIQYTYLDGSVGFGNWWYAIAPIEVYEYGMPGPSVTTSSVAEVWVRIGSTTVLTKDLGTATTGTFTGLAEETEYIMWTGTSNAYGTNYSAATLFTTPADQAKIRIKGNALPDTYQRVEYIQTDGAQMINLGKVGDTVATYDIAFISDNHRQLMGYGGSGSEYWGATDSTKYESGGTQGEATDTTKRRTITWTYSYRDDISKVEYDGVAIVNPNGASKNVDENGYKLFNILDDASAQYGCACKLYGLQMWHYGNLVRNLIPCYRKSDNVIGLFDTVGMTFYTNIGTGSFGKGTNIETGTGWLKGKTYFKKDNTWVKAKKIYIKVNGQWKIGTNYDD